MICPCVCNCEQFQHLDSCLQYHRQLYSSDRQLVPLLSLLCFSYLFAPAGVTSGMLVLIEPGTPAGFANIQEARSSVLDYEGRRVQKLQKRLTDLDRDGSSSSISSSGDAALQAKANSKWFGAHVVAPCPHDAPCPLAVPGSKSWCHFGTRFQRPGFMQQAKAPAGARMNAADHQDERYSYVVLRWVATPVNADAN